MTKTINETDYEVSVNKAALQKNVKHQKEN